MTCPSNSGGRPGPPGPCPLELMMVTFPSYGGGRPAWRPARAVAVGNHEGNCFFLLRWPRPARSGRAGAVRIHEGDVSFLTAVAARPALAVPVRNQEGDVSLLQQWPPGLPGPWPLETMKGLVSFYGGGRPAPRPARAGAVETMRGNCFFRR